MDAHSSLLIEPEGIDADSFDDDALDAWIREAVASNTLSVEAIARAMEADGWGSHEARVLAALGLLRHERGPLRSTLEPSRLQEAVWKLIQHFGAARHDMLLDRATLAAPTPTPLTPRLAAAAAHRPLGDGRSARVRLTCACPELALFDEVLSSEECAGLIDLAQANLDANRVMSDDGDVVDLEARSSSGTFLAPGCAALLDNVEARIATLVGWSVENMEELSVVRYRPGERFTPHWDYFDQPTKPHDRQALEHAGQRIGTVLLYLSDVVGGGATSFDIARLELLPCRGSAAYFAYRLPDGSMDMASLHGGTAVHEGEKWIATLWLRERPYRDRSN